MTYLLDTNAISDLMRADPRIESWLAGLNPADRIVTCTIVRGEILAYGVVHLFDRGHGAIRLMQL